MKIVYLFPLLVLFFVLIVGNVFGLPPRDETDSGGGGGSCIPTTCSEQGKNCGTISNGCRGILNCGGCTSPATCGGGGTANVCGTGGTPPSTPGSTPSSETNCGVAPPTSTAPKSGGKIRVKIDEKDNELWEFYLGSGSNCEIFVTDEDDEFGIPSGDDDGTTYGIKGNIIKHNGVSLDQATNGACSMDSDQCTIYRYRFGSSMDSKCSGLCDLSVSTSEYRPKGDILCGSDYKWYLCDKTFHGDNAQGKFYKIGNIGYRCTKENEWKNAEICDNEKDDDDDTKIDCEDENCYGTDSALINLEPGKAIKCHDKDLTTAKVFYHPSCEPDNDKDKIAGQGTRALNICEQQGLTYSFRKKYNYAVNPALPQDNLNQCCGDDTSDCGKTEIVSSSSSLLCSIDVDNPTQFSKWIRSDGNPDAATGGGHGNIKYVPCSRFEYLSNDIKWTKCAGVFEGNTNEDKNLISANNHHYLCLGSGRGSIVECCGDLSRCNSKGPDGQRLKTGEFRTKKCGNGIADQGEQCGEPTLSNCQSGQSCNGCICSGITRACTPTDQCRTNTDCDDSSLPVCSSCSCVAAPSGCTAADECRDTIDCIRVGQVCSSCRCVAGSSGTGTCRDGIIQTPNSNGINEQCDGTNVGDEICYTYLGPEWAGPLTCTSTCTFDTSNCIFREDREESPTTAVVASITGNSILKITGYAIGTPDESSTVNNIAAEVGLSGFGTDEYSVFHGFVKIVAQRLNPTDNPSGWGLLSKSSGEKNVDGFAVDAIIYGEAQQVVDIVAGSGLNPSPAWQLVSKRSNNNWVAPSAAGRTSGSSGGSGGSGSGSGTSTSSGKYYCTLNGQFEFLNLDRPSPGLPAPNYNNKFTCIGVGLSWTGTKCCGEPDQRPEYYNDPSGGPTNTETSPNRFPNGCTGSCDAPYFKLKYEQDVLNAIITVGGVDLSTQARVDSYRQAVIDELKSKGFIGATNPINCNGNPSVDSIIIGKQSDQYAEYYDIVIGYGSSNPSPGIGYEEPANWQRCPRCGQSSPSSCAQPSTTGSTGSSGIGGCWNSRFVPSISFVAGTDNSVINYGGIFHGCAIDKKNYNTRNDALLGIKDTHTRAQLITDHSYCFNDHEKNYFCSYTEKWIQTDGKDRSKLSTSPLANAAQKSECCGATQCWDGNQCVDDQKNKPLEVLGEGYKCIDGDWKKLSKKCSPDEEACGYCSDESQCMLNPQVANPCVNSSEYYGDNYCDNGIWSTRTKLLALKMLAIKSASDDFTLFCDNKENTLNNLVYVTDSGDVASSIIANLDANNFCVLKFKDKIVVGTSINKDIGQVKGGLNIFGVTSCSNARDDGNYYSCDSTSRVWYNKKLKILIYSATPIAVTPAQEPSSSLSDAIRSIINKIMALITTPPFDESYVNSIKRFDKLYLAKQGSKSVRGALEGKNFKNAVIEYNGFDKLNICAYTDSFNKAGNFALSGISCRKEESNYYVLAQGSRFTSFNPEDVWTDLTAKLRLK